MSWLRLFQWGVKSSTPDDLVQFEMPAASRDGELDQYSSTWAYVENWAITELQKARESNDSTKRDAIETAALRGRIRMLKELIALPKPKDRQRRIPIPQDEYEY